MPKSPKKSPAKKAPVKKSQRKRSPRRRSGRSKSPCRNFIPTFDVDEDIIKYLLNLECLSAGEEFKGKDLEKSYSAELHAKAILADILKGIERRARLKESYEKKRQQHNQYELFDLAENIPDFHIDDKMYEKLLFRETLIISSFLDAENPLTPVPVGGLSLDVQKAKGSNPLNRQDVGLDQVLVETITGKIQDEIDAAQAGSCPPKPRISKPQRIARPCSKTLSSVTPINNPEKRSELSGLPGYCDCPLVDSQVDLKNYEEFLDEQMKQEYCKFLVHLSSQFSFEGMNGGSNITAWVDRNLHTLEEKRREFLVDSNEILNEKSLYIGLQQKRYFVKHKSTLESLDKRMYYSLQKAKHLVCEGSNFLLMRYLAISRFIGTFELSTAYINGDLCRNIYVCKGPESGLVNGINLDICRIYRVIREECGIKHTCCTILTLYGQIIKQEWKHCDFVLQLNPLAEVYNTKPKGSLRIKLAKTWREDLQMFSTFLDQKNVSYLQIKSYLLDHPEIKDMLADYVQSILLMKPDDILNFTKSHFMHLAPERLPRNGYLEGEDEDDESFHI